MGSCRAHFYQQNSLEPNYEEEIPVLNGKEINTFEFHMEKDSNHISKTNICIFGKIIKNGNKFIMLHLKKYH